MWELICFALAASPILVGLTCVGRSLWEHRPQAIAAPGRRRGGPRP
jgi:hypothetical protein